MKKSPFSLKCEYLSEPIAIDIPNPRFSWLLSDIERNQNQSAYQIIVSSTEERAKKEEGDFWDSGKIKSDKLINIKYGGTALISNEVYFWRVKWWDKNDNASKYSKIARFETALLEDSSWSAEWISKREFIEKSERKKHQFKTQVYIFRGQISIYKGIYLRKEFKIEKPILKAKIHVCGLGHYELRLNGNKIGTRILDPGWTDYKKLALYSTYDITKSLKEKNAIGVILGSGRHISAYGYDFPKLILQINITYEDGTTKVISTDESWKVSKGPLQENGIFFGENYDARLEMPGWDDTNFDQSSWDSCVKVEGPELKSQLMQPIEVTKVLKPKKMYSSNPGAYVYDFGQNFTGVVRLKVRGPKGQEIKIRYSEITYDDGAINPSTNRDARCANIYILKGEGTEIYQPRFTYHGFRYVEITGFPGVPTLENVEGLFFHSNVERIGAFNCSKQIINQIHKNVIWGQLSNLMSIPTDSPQRDERQGWMGDAQLTVEEAIYNFDMARFYTKYLHDIISCQKKNGKISDVVPPYWRFYPADPAWGSAYIIMVWYLYWYYEDREILEKHYNSLRKYVDFLTSKSEGNLLLFLMKYGDWCPPGNVHPKKTPLELTSSWYYYHDVLFLSKIAKILEKEEEYKELSELSEAIKVAFNKKFLKVGYMSKTIFPGDESPNQTSNILPLYLNMVPDGKREQVIDLLLRSVVRICDNHVDTGIIGTRYLFDVLTESGYPEVAYKVITQESYPSWGYMIKEGATTLWERWEKLEGGGMNSHNHIMLGSVDTWFYKCLAGINVVEPGWKKLFIKPYFESDLKYVSASLNTYRGLISVCWEKTENNIKLTIDIPIGSKAQLSLPLFNENMIIKEHDQIIWKNNSFQEGTNDIFFKEVNDNCLNFEFGSGFYQFDLEKI